MFFLFQTSAPWPVFKSNSALSGGVLMAENESICKFDDSVDGFIAWLGAYYVFDCEYPKEASMTLRFLQRVILGLKAKLQCPVRVLKLRAELDAVVATSSI